MTKGMLSQLEEYRKDASAAEKKLIDLLLRNPDQLIGKSIHQLSEMVYASPATIIRLCKKLGCSGYREFQQNLVYEMALLESTRSIFSKKGITFSSTKDIIQNVTQKNVDTLELSKKLVDETVIEACVNAIEESRMIHFFGIGASLLVAKDFYLKMLRVEKLCSYADDWHLQMLAAKSMGTQDLAIIFSYSGMTEEMIACAEVVKDNGAKVIVITSANDSKLAKQADYVLFVAATESLIRSGAMSSRISQLNMVDILYSTYISKHYERCMKILPKTYVEKKKKKSVMNLLTVHNRDGQT